MHDDGMFITQRCIRKCSSTSAIEESNWQHIISHVHTNYIRVATLPRRLLFCSPNNATASIILASAAIASLGGTSLLHVIWCFILLLTHMTLTVLSICHTTTIAPPGPSTP
mmetsp:Transcript_22936/g.40597  ORF Transcript_22936/g.40597 Transcript_22936/m.40597 type:complete len:111 (-) Transcript_22936:997-1329(-)